MKFTNASRLFRFGGKVSALRWPTSEYPTHNGTLRSVLDIACYAVGCIAFAQFRPGEIAFGDPLRQAPTHILYISVQDR